VQLSKRFKIKKSLNYCQFIDVNYIIGNLAKALFVANSFTRWLKPTAMNSIIAVPFMGRIRIHKALKALAE